MVATVAVAVPANVTRAVATVAAAAVRPARGRDSGSGSGRGRGGVRAATDDAAMENLSWVARRAKERNPAAVTFRGTRNEID